MNPSAPSSIARVAPRTAPPPAGCRLEDDAPAWPALQQLRDAFRSTGGLMEADQLAGLLSHRLTQPVSRLARWIVARHVVSVSVGGQAHLPLFQFQHDFGGLQPTLPAVLAELTPMFNDEELAQWFARSNGSLDGALPADRLASDGAAVLLAARTDRFLASLW